MPLFQIKHRFTMKVLFEKNCESLKVCVEAAVKSGANLPGAYLSGANLPGANLYRAYLYRAYLSRANLSGAYLYKSKGINPHRTTPLLMLLDQPGHIRLYKLVTEQGTGPTYTSITYKIGETYIEPNADTNVQIQCAAGLNLATLDWCMKEWEEGYRILIAEFDAKDIAAIPTATDGKIRVKKCKIVGEKDLIEIGLVKGED